MAAARELSDSKETVETITTKYKEYFESVRTTLTRAYSIYEDADPELCKKEQQTLNPSTLKKRCEQLNCLDAFDEYRMLQLKEMLSDEFSTITTIRVTHIRKFCDSINLYSLEEFDTTFKAVYKEKFKTYANSEHTSLLNSTFKAHSTIFDSTAGENFYLVVLEEERKALIDEFREYFNTNKDIASYYEEKQSDMGIRNFKKRFILLNLKFDEYLAKVMNGRILSFIQNTVEYPYFAEQTTLSRRDNRLFSSYKSKNADATNTMRKKLDDLRHARIDTFTLIDTIIEYRKTLLNNKSKRTLPILDAYLFPIVMPHVEHRNLTLEQRNACQYALKNHMEHYFDPTTRVTYSLLRTALIPVPAATNDNPQLMKLNTCINEILIGCLAFAAKESDYNLFLLAPDSERLRGRNKFSLFDARHLPLAEKTCRALIAIRDTNTIPVEHNIDLVVATIAGYRNQLSMRHSKRYLNKFDAYFRKEMKVEENEYKDNFTKCLEKYIAEKAKLPQHDLVVASSATPRVGT